MSEGIQADGPCEGRVHTHERTGSVSDFGNGVISRTQKSGKYGSKRGDAAGKHCAVFCAGHRAQLILKDHLVYVAVAGLESTATACRLVEQDAFISVLPLYAVKTSVEAGALKIVSIPQWEHRQAIQIALHRSKTVTPQIEGFLEELSLMMDTTLAERL